MVKPIYVSRRTRERVGGGAAVSSGLAAIAAGFVVGVSDSAFVFLVGLLITIAGGGLVAFGTYTLSSGA